VLLDTCVWNGAADPLREAGFDEATTGRWERDPGDAEILAFAARERRVVITLGKDFGELAVVHEPRTQASFAWSTSPRSSKGRQRSPRCNAMRVSSGSARS
jgi:hypothetical protein